jgi:hypothetical protein
MNAADPFRNLRHALSYHITYSELLMAVKLILLPLLSLTPALLDMYIGLCPALICRYGPIRAKSNTFSVSAKFSKWMPRMKMHRMKNPITPLLRVNRFYCLVSEL